MKIVEAILRIHTTTAGRIMNDIVADYGRGI